MSGCSGGSEGRRLVPYWRRADIDAGRLAGRGLELAWARDPVDVFFMEVQGSGTLRFPDGRERRVGYAGANGRPYRAIGRLLIHEGHVPREAMSMQAIRAWLPRQPGGTPSASSSTTSPYVFFRPLAGPPGGQPGPPPDARALGRDRCPPLPAGALAFLETRAAGAGPGRHRPLWSAPGAASS